MTEHGDNLGLSVSEDRFEVACTECSTALESDAERCHHCGKQKRGTGWTSIDTLGDPWLGRVLADRYRLLRKIGRGASGNVHEAESLSISRTFAVKIIDFSRSEIGGGATRAEQRFEREVETLGELRNPHIVSVYDLLRPTDDAVAIVMDMVGGRTLREVICQDGPMEPAAAAHLIQQVANGLHEAHELGIVHRDIKPANIIVEELPAGDYFAHILDFGVVYRRGEASDVTQGFVGTPLYTSPEQARGDEVDRRADIYSLGATGFFMFTGRPPFEEDNAFAALRAHLQQSAPRLSVASDHAIPPELDDLMASLLAKDPDRRPSTLTSVIDKLESIHQTGVSSGQPVLAVDQAPGSTQDSSAAYDEVVGETTSDADIDQRESKEAAVIKPHQITSSVAEDDAADESATAPGTTDPGTTAPGTTEPGTTEPGATGEGAEVCPVRDDSEAAMSSQDVSDSLLEVDADTPIDSSVLDASLSTTRLAVLDRTGVVHVADADGGFKHRIEVGGARRPTAVAVDTDTIFVGDDRGQVHRCNVETGDIELLFSGPSSNAVVSLATCSQGIRLVVAFADGDVIYYDMSDAEREAAYQLGPAVPVSTLAICPEFGGFAVCRADKTVTLHSIEKPDLPVAEFETTEVVDKAAFSKDAHLLAVSERGGALEIYHADTGHQLMPTTTLPRQPMTLVFDRDDQLSAMCEIEGVIYRWNLQGRFLQSEAGRGHHTVE